MAGQDRTQTQHLIDALIKAPERFDFFQAVRLIECINADKPRLGTSKKAADDPVRFTQPPELDFARSALASFRIDPTHDKPPHMAVNFMGLFGPHGPLPLHLTEYTRERLKHHHDATLADFANIFHHRMISLFYRAWANTRPVVCYDRPETDRFADYVGTTFGIGAESLRHRDALDDRAKLFYAGRFALQTKTPDGLQAIVSDILNTKTQIYEFVGEWMSIQPADQTRLGLQSAMAVLGESALIGASVWGCQHKFRIVLGRLSLTKYLSLLPGGQSLPQLIAIVRNYLGDELVWDVNLLLNSAQVPAEICLGTPAEPDMHSLNGHAQLGWSMWLGPRNSQQDADDLTLNPFIAEYKVVN